MSKVSVSEAADRLGVNAQRVHQRIADGSLPAIRIGHQWVIDEADLARLDRRPAGRPLSAKSAWSLAIVAAALDADGFPQSHPSASVSGSQPTPAPVASELAPWDRSRARARLRQLLDKAVPSQGNDDESQAADIAAELRSLLRKRAQRHLWRSAPRDLEELRSDGRISLSGISLPSSGLASADIVEGYIAEQHLDNLVDEFLLREAVHAEANVVLHVVNSAVMPHGEFKPDGWLLLAADLAEHHRPREIAKAAQLVRQVAVKHPALKAERSR